MNRKILQLLLIFLFISVLKSSAQTEKIRFGMKYNIKSHNFEILDDVPNHKMGLAHGTGVAYVKTGNTAIVNVYFIYDYINGKGSFVENYVIQMGDSSKLTLKAEGVSFGDESNPLFNASVTIVNGTGEYAGIKGKGRMSGDRKDILADNTTVNLNFDLEYTFGN
jgi:hypothetical protein